MINGRKAILVVDDDKMTREIFRENFGDKYIFLEAQDGAEAIAVLEKRHQEITMIILDLIMPVSDGYEVLQRIMEQKEWREIPVVISTSNTSEESDLKLVELGAQLIIHKPYNIKVVMGQLKNILKHYQQEQLYRQERYIQKYLISRKSKLFFCSYHIPTQSLDIDESYVNYIAPEFIHVFDRYPFSFESVCLPFDKDRLENMFSYSPDEDSSREIVVRLKKENPFYEWYRITVFFKTDDNHALCDIDCLVNNINDEMEAKEHLEFLANSDVLTHIPNARAFYPDMMKMLEQYRDLEFSMIIFDIEQFRTYNTLFGRDEGDRVLTFLATKLQEEVESYDKGVYCRMSSDTFYACIEKKENSVALFVDFLQSRIREYPINFEIQLCFGIYDIQQTDTRAEEIINHAIYTWRIAKQRLFDNVVFYDEKIREQEYFENMVVSEMDVALQNKEFEVFFQPKFDISTGCVCGSEALIRWNHPREGYLSPAIFIPIFEKNGFITSIDFFVFEEVCKKIREWLAYGYDPVPISVNISRADLYDPILWVELRKIYEKYRVPLKYVEFEITESAFISDTQKLKEFSKEIQEFGCKILVDDFGSGYSSLNSLKDIYVDVLKIDIKFLPATAEDEKAKIILASVIEMAKALDLDVIAEGVETEVQKNLLEELGCNKIQGFYYYRPMPLADYEKIMKYVE